MSTSYTQSPTPQRKADSAGVGAVGAIDATIGTRNLIVPPHPNRTSVLVLLSLALLGLLVSKSSDNAPSANITTAQVSIGPITRRIVATGTLQPAKMVDASAQVSGTVQDLAVDFNSRVRAGQVLAQIDPLTYEAQMKEAQGKLAQAEAGLARAISVDDDAGTQLSRAEALAAACLISRADLDAARIAKQRATIDRSARDADIAAAHAALNQARVQRDHTSIRSRIDGVVIGRFVDRGQTVRT